jgi:hypothetical protein
VAAGLKRDESASRFRLLFEHDLFGKPLRTFPDHALVPIKIGKQPHAQYRHHDTFPYPAHFMLKLVPPPASATPASKSAENR